MHGYLESPEDFLWTILVGNTLANFAAVGLVVVLLHQWLGAMAGAAGRWFSGVDVFVLRVLRAAAEDAVSHVSEPAVPGAGGAVSVHSLVLSPLVSVMTKLSRGLLRWTGGKTFTGHLFGSREEMRLFMQESAQGLTSEERMMINRVLDLQKIARAQRDDPDGASRRR